jgi:beta-galactosidase
MPIWYGGDYNPEQWSEDVWPEDIQLMKRGKITLATVGVFSWAKFEPREGVYDFDWFDRVLDGLHAGGMRIDLATATASPPPWLTSAYPEVLPVDQNGIRLHPGSRQQYCPSSPVYRAHAARLVRALADRYGDHPGLELWHVNNEYGCHVHHCYCDVSALAFRSWLRAKYGDIPSLNEAWGTAFWSQRYGTFDEIFPPRAAPTFKNPTQLLDFDRFSSDELLECYRGEVAILRAATPHVPITTNFMGFFKAVDYWKWAAEVDIVSDDSYPDPADPDSAEYASMVSDLMRSLGGGAPWILMEQAPSAVNWRARNAAKAPGQMRAWSYQALARGADGILFFQWRQSAAGAEKFHSGLVPHSGTDTRAWREVEQLGTELELLSQGPLPIVGERVPARVGIVFNWDSWWAIEQPASPTTLSYLNAVFAWHREFTARSITVDFVQPTQDLSGYDLVVVPSLFCATDAQLVALDAFARSGGVLVVTYQTGITDENLRIRLGGYLGVLQTTLGLWIEEFAPPAGPDLSNAGDAAAPPLRITGDVVGGESSATLWSEFVRLTGATNLAEFSDGPLAGWPAVTRNAVGAGSGWYVATQPHEGGMSKLVDALLDDAGVAGIAVTSDPNNTRGVQAVVRGELTFIVNHGDQDATVAIAGTDVLSGMPSAGLVLSPQGVAIVARRQ